MSKIMKIILFSTKVTAIKIIILFLVLLSISLSQALEFSLDSPETADSEFKVSISSDLSNLSDIYDVKIYVFQDKKTDRLSQIYDNDWKSSFFYIKSAFPETTEFNIKVSNFSGQSTICAKLRKSGQTSFKEVCNPIQINNKLLETDNKNNNEDNEAKLIENKKTNKQQAIEVKAQQINLLSDNSSNINNYAILANEKIILNSPKKESKNFISKEEKIRKGLLYSMIFLTAVLFFIITFRHIRHKRNMNI